MHAVERLAAVNRRLIGLRVLRKGVGESAASSATPASSSPACRGWRLWRGLWRRSLYLGRQWQRERGNQAG
jgi:hypothetical protein